MESGTTYLVSAYAVVLLALAGYALRLYLQARSLRRQITPPGPRPGDRG